MSDGHEQTTAETGRSLKKNQTLIEAYLKKSAAMSLVWVLHEEQPLGGLLGGLAFVPENGPNVSYVGLHLLPILF